MKVKLFILLLIVAFSAKAQTVKGIIVNGELQEVIGAVDESTFSIDTSQLTGTTDSIAEGTVNRFSPFVLQSEGNNRLMSTSGESYFEFYATGSTPTVKARSLVAGYPAFVWENSVQLWRAQNDVNGRWSLDHSTGKPLTIFPSAQDDFFKLDVGGLKLGGGSMATHELEVEGTVSATEFIGDGSQLTNIPEDTLKVSSTTIKGFEVMSEEDYLNITPETGVVYFLGILEEEGTLLSGTAFSHQVTEENYSVSTLAFDGNITNFYASTDTPIEKYIGLDLGSGNEMKITRVRIYPRTDFVDRFENLVIEGANDAEDGTYTVIGNTGTGLVNSQFKEVNFTDTTVDYRFIRFRTDNNDSQSINVSEIEIYGK